MCTEKKISSFKKPSQKRTSYSETSYWKDQFKNANTNKDFWKLVNKVKRKQKDCRIGPPKDSRGNLVTDDKQKAEIMNSYFATIDQSLAEHIESNTNVNSVEYIYRMTPKCQQLEMDEKHFNQQFKDLKGNWPQ